jgi:hypothetical protein
MLKYERLQSAPLAKLALVALDGAAPFADRLRHWEALHARRDEFAGAGWLLMEPIERDRVSRALALDMTREACAEFGRNFPVRDWQRDPLIAGAPKVY